MAVSLAEQTAACWAVGSVVRMVPVMVDLTAEKTAVAWLH